MDWYVVDKDYCNYLYGIDKKVGFVDYGDRLKLHIGIVLEVNGYQYYIPISSPKAKHYKMSNSIDFQKIEDPITNELYAVININNMIPVPRHLVTKLKYDKIQNYRIFSSDKERTDYIYLLQKEKVILDTLNETIIGKAERLYQSYIKNPNSRVSRRCCDFIALNRAAGMYTK